MATPIITLEQVAKQYAERPLLQDVSLSIAPGERVGVVGVNGSGKTTLLRIVAGDEPPDSGRVSAARGMRVAYLPQNPALESGLTVLEQLFQADTPAMQLVRAYQAATLELARAPGDRQLQDRLAGLVEQIDAQSAWDLEQAARTILTRLGLTQLEARIGELSGGQRKRVAMAAALINPADLLILDEPTNQIDTATVAWLEEFLSRATAALLLVTHDRYFLERVCQRIVEVDAGRLYSYPGSYSRFLELKAERQAQQASDEARRQTILKKELAWLQRGARARTTKQQARIDRVDALRAGAPERERAALEISSAARRLGKKVVELRGVSKRYGQRLLIDDFSLTIGPGERLGIIGPNGSGKTTLLNIIAGRVAPDAGTVEVGTTVHMTLYDQESADLDEAQRAIEYVKEAAEVVQTSDGSLITAAQMLERFLFPPASHYSLIAKLSGGERRRLYLARKLMEAPNVLLLDEPTNDLDIQTLAVLEDYLDSFSGTVVAVSHDRYFLDRVVERTLAFEDGAIREYPGGYSAYAEAVAAREAAAAAASQPKPRPQTPAAPRPERPRRLTSAEMRELRQLERTIAEFEQQQAALGERINTSGGDYQALQRLTAELGRTEAALEAAFQRWAELAEIAEGS
jgi:ATP-binding cassette subfamily F protein uup